LPEQAEALGGQNRGSEVIGSFAHRPGSHLLIKGFPTCHEHSNILRLIPPGGTPTDTPIIEALSG